MSLVLHARDRTLARGRAATALLSAVGFAAAFLATCLLSRSLVEVAAPEPDIPILSAKLAQLLAERDEVTAVFVGTSRVYRHVVPQVFDAQLGRKGRTSRSFNLGLPGMTLAEARHLLRVMADSRPERLRWVFLEPLEMDIDYENLLTPRVLASHDLDNSRFAVFQAWRADGSWLRRAKNVRNHVLALVCSSLGFGRLSAALLNGPEHRSKKWATPPAGSQGYVALDDEPMLRRRNRIFLEEHLPDFRRAVDAFRPNAGKSRSSSRRLAPEMDGYRDLLEIIRGTGARPLFLLSPSVVPLPVYEQIVEAHETRFPDVPLIGRRTPADSPALFEPQLWFDQRHLNRTGAIRYSRSLAAEFERVAESL